MRLLVMASDLIESEYQSLGLDTEVSPAEFSRSSRWNAWWSNSNSHTCSPDDVLMRAPFGPDNFAYSVTGPRKKSSRAR